MTTTDSIPRSRESSAPTPRTVHRRRRPIGAPIATHAILIVFSVLAILPLVSIVLASLQPLGSTSEGLQLPRALDFANYVRAWNNADFSVLMRNSFIVAACVVPLGSVICILTGYAFGTMRFRGERALFTIFLIGLLMPFEATIVPLYYDLRSIGLANTYAGLVLPETALFLSFGTFWMRASFLATERSLVEAARIDGANSWTTLWRVLVPNAWPAITTMVVLFFIWSWNEFLLALVLTQDHAVQTAPAGLGLFTGEHGTDTSGLAAAAIIMTVPALIVYVLLQRHFVQGVTSGGVKG
ncbi:carbohydrate ABC transporter permease [Leifsonia sp. TF02-11]|uniref:carbohydrate ABC transporter permease n=1 Tax=Leifsonia sp. TF02-11 TaxID=2815212 RepID=UPI001AA1569D|nr:carbohydrate ABC transporter permease [Leifsonia sp. TF02-11]MBO1740618.1 carbohydrate ABC transporter permease [Leifsonia sp. TF02-11]